MLVSRRGLVLLLSTMAVSIWAALAGGAEAREVAHLRGDLVSPRLFGGEVAWMDQDCPGCFLLGASSDRFRVFATGLSANGAPVLLSQGLTYSSLGGSVSSYESVDFDVSRTSLAIRREKIVSGLVSGESRRLRFGARGRPPPLIVACDTHRDLPYAVDGNRLLYGDSCGSEAHEVVLLDGRTSERRTLAVIDPATSSIRGVHLADDFAAYVIGSREEQEIVVARVSGGADGYTVQVPVGVDAGGIDLDAEGRLAVLAPAPPPGEEACAGTGLSWYSIAEPFAHPLAVEPCPTPISWAGDRIMYQGGPAPNDVATQIRAVGLDSRDGLVVDAGRVALDSFDADERNLAYGVSACDGGTKLLVVSLSERVRSAPATCPATLASRRVHVGPRRARIKLRCPRGCSGTIRLRYRGRSVSRDPWFRQAGRRGTHSVRLPRGLRHLAARRGTIAAVVRIRFADRTVSRTFTERTHRVTLIDTPRSQGQ